MDLTGGNGSMGKLPKLGAIAILAWSGTLSAQTLMEAASYTIESSPDVAIVKKSVPESNRADRYI